MRGWNVKELAARAGIPYSRLNRVVNGVTLLTMDDAVVLKKALKTCLPLEYLFDTREDD